ncbi:hypothetical protein ACPW96_16675 [Micromonospora sp. DT81.3]|uniref:hypothetical protein n=1 Tax=Micromonospora sp. DT81.3 TaxID=3416523 RepID=UPI003CF3A397
MGKVDLAGKLNDARARVESETVDAAQRRLPKFARLMRKEARVREDQFAALSALARTLMRQRTVKDERITENTLMRIAIDHLLAHRHVLRSTEDELRNSLTPAAPKSASPGLPVSATDRPPTSGTSPVPVSGFTRPNDRTHARHQQPLACATAAHVGLADTGVMGVIR